ncbi:P-loop NTPase fold protein [Parasediminibacterium paludis]|uniref:P-loop NTPase fold protein n=1 Tax=Parasediminibacterium paludis TaxID=908966 RepID=A0ABV8PWE3_9BACT
MNTENIEKIFTDYLKTDKTQYAILLNGSWGSGKTYFWKYSLNKIALDNGFKTIYLSLNGISKIDALEHLLFLKLIPFIGNQENTLLKNTTRILGNVINQASKAVFKTSLTDIFKDISVDSFNFSKYVICFDDLERCQIPIKEVLGFINNFVEHKSLKTLILADETNIDTTQKGYDNIKEKVIGRVLNFELNIAVPLPQIFKKYEVNNPDFYQFLLSKEQVLINILLEYKQDNLRIIGFYLDVLEKLFPAFKNIDEKYIEELILFSALITIEFKKGKLTSADYKDPKGIDDINEHYYSLNIAQTMRNSEKEETARDKSYAEIFYEKYLDKQIKNYFFYPSVYSYILSGYLNQNDLTTEIKNRYPEVISPEVQDFRNLLDYKFRQLSDEDFQTLSANVLKYAKEGKYWLYDYVQIANFFYFFSKNKLIDQSKDDIDKILHEGLEVAKEKKQINDRVLENLLHFGDENPDVTKIKQLVKKIHFEIKKEEYVAEGNEFIDCLANKDEFALTAIFEKHKFSKELFQYVDDKLFFDTILKTSNKLLFNFTELLGYRYNINNIGEFLFEDTTCLKSLKDNLAIYLDNTENILQPRKFLLATLHEKLMLTIEHLNDTRKK